ncbi:biopolymer transporter ExbD [Shimia sp. CNT1-13L.2]|nr:biopolymer transporter ExbD [Shimia sp. CNT1-13L.2]MCP9484108.1 biopolymer transporter ExbD [Shimia sp. CNT1-13L.2]
MIDVVFLLLVFFMLASRFGMDHVLPVPLAGQGNADLSGPPRLISVDAESLRLNGIAMPQEALLTELERIMDTPEQALILRAGDQVELQRIIDITESLQSAGFPNVVLLE